MREWRTLIILLFIICFVTYYVILFGFERRAVDWGISIDGNQQYNTIIYGHERKKKCVVYLYCYNTCYFILCMKRYWAVWTSGYNDLPMCVCVCVVYYIVNQQRNVFSSPPHAFSSPTKKPVQ